MSVISSFTIIEWKAEKMKKMIKISIYYGLLRTLHLGNLLFSLSMSKMK